MAKTLREGVGMTYQTQWELPKDIARTDDATLSRVHATGVEELRVLEGVIIYATRERQHDSRYDELRRHAYGKAITVEKEDGSREVFRVSQANLVYPNRASGYATPQSPIGRLCAIAQPGFSRHSREWGDYEVVEVRHFTRYTGVDAENNINNFRQVALLDEKAGISVDNLAVTVARIGRTSRGRPPEAATTAPIDGTLAGQAESVTSLIPVSEPIEPPVPQPPRLTVLEVDDEDEPAYDEDTEFEERDEALVVNAEQERDDYFGLNNHFFLNRTREQDRIMSRSPLGPLLVEGVAGSGKTSAALGRTKVLCDFQSQQETAEDRARYRDLLGEDRSGWGSDVAGFFQPESSVGFVRTAELTSYLEASCKLLGLTHLPIVEFGDLRHRLLEFRDLAQRSTRAGGGGHGKSRYALDPEARSTSGAETTMEWLHTADAAIAARLCEQYADTDQFAASSKHRFKETERADGILAAVRREFAVRLQPVIDALGRHRHPIRPFHLDGLVQRLCEVRNRMNVEVLDKDAYWIEIGGTWHVFRSLVDAAGELMRQREALFGDQTTRLVWGFAHAKELAANGALFFTEGAAIGVADGAALETAATVGALVVQLGEERFRVKFIDQEDLYLRLVGQGGRLYRLRGGRLSPVRAVRQLLQQSLELDTADPEDLDEATDEAESGAAESDSGRPVTAGKAKTVRLINIVRNALRTHLFAPLRFADLYAKALAAPAAVNWAEAVAVEMAAVRLARRCLAEHDIDLLLCLAHIASAGCSDEWAPEYLRTPPFYRSVFIDEVQDFTEQQVFLMAHQAEPRFRAVTVVGDMQQQLMGGTVRNLQACFPYEADLPTVRLLENKRQAARPELALYSQAYRWLFQEDADLAIDAERLETAFDALWDGNAYDFLDHEKFDERLDAVFEVIERQPLSRTIAVVLPDQVLAAEYEARLRERLQQTFRQSYVSERVDLAKKYLVHFTSPRNVKGLEFDTVVLVEPERFDFSDAVARNAVYVVLSRPRRELIVVGDLGAATDRVAGFFRLETDFIELSRPGC